MLTIEKVILLKGVGMFAATSEDILADVATILEEVELNGGELVFGKGEQGDSMYIIINGRVCGCDGDKTFKCLGEREIVGELARLDPIDYELRVEKSTDAEVRSDAAGDPHDQHVIHVVRAEQRPGHEPSLAAVRSGFWSSRITCTTPFTFSTIFITLRR